MVRCANHVYLVIASILSPNPFSRSRALIMCRRYDYLRARTVLVEPLDNISMALPRGLRIWDLTFRGMRRLVDLVHCSAIISSPCGYDIGVVFSNTEHGIQGT